ncbi:serine hydrolase domain-containing protein [Pseudoxanthomonas winnipegensis]|uniref:serine hydrolase domain-containing protein n=1 Tax=Pseudoxanthomonas winnipegensis TaxID=2480810 RepID=UPI001040DDCA|nr:serine hydrolase domain-containing protein [Pseudoxanthomonas winnipegensis]TBV74443.1 serine hydrolase [Pseudoxanthomonas winnipegensis]
MFKHTGKALALAGLLLASGPSAAADAPAQASFDTLFDQAMARYRLPGLAVGVVEDGKVVYLRTAGETRAGSGEKIDADTLFKIASNTKAMTTGVLARLVDQGKLKWDDPVTQYLPQFRMADPWVTRNFQVRDLLIHNSGLGLGAGDLMLWPEPNDFTRADIIAGLAYLQPTHSFRAHYAYDNLMYVVAGEVAAKAGGKPYDQLVRQELFGPLGMSRCQVGAFDRDAVGNLAQPHMVQDGRNVVVRADGPTIPDNPSMSAGGIRCSVRDLTTWIAMWLAPDAAHPWLSAQQRAALWTLHTPMPIGAQLRDWDGTHLYGYGYGWRLSDVDGQWRVAHTGTLMGMYSSVTLLPDRKVGFVVLINGDGEAARTTLTEALTKHYTRPGAGLDIDHYAGLLEQARARAAANATHPQVPDTSDRKPATAAQFARWHGVYRDPWFGQVSLCPQGQGVVFRSARSPLMRGPVLVSHGRWLVDWDDASVDAEPWLDFAQADGKTTLTLKSIDPDADFSYDYQDLHFQRVAACPAQRGAADP